MAPVNEPAKLGDKPQEVMWSTSWQARDGKNKTIAEKLATGDAAIAAALEHGA